MLETGSYQAPYDQDRYRQSLRTDLPLGAALT